MMTQTSRAIYLILQGPSKGAFELREVPTPIPGPQQVAIQVSHSGLNYADVMARLGLYNDCPPLPCVLGYEVVGLVMGKGAEVTGIDVGDRVLAFTKFGGYSSHVLAEVAATIRLSADDDGAQACALATQYCTAWYAAVMSVNLAKGDRVLIHAAAGGVGLALCQIALKKGCQVFATVGSDKKREVLERLGVKHTINYRKQDFELEIKRLVGPHRLDVAFDPVGGKSFRKSFNLLGHGGRIVTFGASEWSNSKGTWLDKIRLVLNFGFLHPIGLLMKSKSVLGVNMLRIAESKPEYLERCIKEVYQAYRDGWLTPVVDSLWNADEVVSAHERLEHRESTGKIVLRW